MRIDETKDYKTYVFVSFIISFFLLGFYIWIQKVQSQLFISYEVQKNDSIINLTVKNALWFGQKPVYTFLSESNLNELIKVKGANRHQKPSSRTLSNYPFSHQDSVTYPEASVLAISSAEKNSYHWYEAQFKTFLKDSLPLPVVSLLGADNDFFGIDGLYSVKDETYEEVVHKIIFEFFSEEGERLLSTPVKTTVAGMSTKKLPMKSLNIFFDQEGVNSQLFFRGRKEKKQYSLKLRSAGNDFLLAYMRDVIVSELTRKMDIIRMDYQPVVVFINGEFWGIQYLREHISEENILATHPELTKEQVQLGELHKNEALSISNGFGYKLDSLMRLVETQDLTIKANHEQLNKTLNLNNFIDYVIIETFISNTDWPHNNVKGVFLQDQLHFILYDTDFGFAYPFYYQKHTDDIFNMPSRYYEQNALEHNFFNSLDHHLPSHIGRLYHSLIQYDFFREKFINRYFEILENDFSQGQIEKVVAGIRSKIEPAMPHHIARWGYPKSMEDWYLHTEQIIDFCAERRVIVSEQLTQLEQVLAKRSEP